VRELISSAPELIDAYSPDGFHPLGYACFFDRRELLELLLHAGADLEAPARNSAGHTPADLARQNGHQEVAALLELAV